MAKSFKIAASVYGGIALGFFLFFSYREISEHSWEGYLHGKRKVTSVRSPAKYRWGTVVTCLWKAAAWPYYGFVRD